jgi:signal peptidase
MKESSILSFIVDLSKWLLTLALGAVVLILTLPLFTPYRIMVVLSGSMAPSLLAGDAVLIRSGANPIHEGDIVTFQREGQLVTHRVVGVESGQLITQGDANNGPDPWPVPLSAVEGIYVLRLPFLGYLVWFARKPIGWVALVILPATVLVIGEVRNLLSLSKSHSEEG